MSTCRMLSGCGPIASPELGSRTLLHTTVRAEPVRHSRDKNCLYLCEADALQSLPTVSLHESSDRGRASIASKLACVLPRSLKDLIPRWRRFDETALPK